MNKCTKELIILRHWSIELSNLLYFLLLHPELKHVYEAVLSRALLVFSLDVSYKISTTRLFLINNQPQEIDCLCHCSNDDIQTALKDMGISTAVSVSEDVIQLLFADLVHWPNGSGKSPDYLVNIDGNYYNLEVKACLCERLSNRKKISCNYNNALRNKNTVKLELMDLLSEICNTICAMIYYYIDIDQRLVHFFDIDIIAMPLLPLYKIVDGYVTDLRVKSEGENSLNNNATIGAKILKSYELGNTLYDVYMAYLNPEKRLISNLEYRFAEKRKKRYYDNLHKAVETYHGILSVNSVFKQDVSSANKSRISKLHKLFLNIAEAIKKDALYDHPAIISKMETTVETIYNSAVNVKIPRKKKVA